MATSQPGIFARGTRAHHFVELAIEGAPPPAALREALRVLRAPVLTDEDLNVVVALSPALAGRLAPDGLPDELTPLPAIPGLPRPRADVFVWLHTATPDVALDGARAVAGALGHLGTLVGDLAGFAYRDRRDLTGFIDGTENPRVDEAPGVAVVADGPGAGGSFVLASRWRHDLAAFSKLSETDQELVIGRTKFDSVELPADLMPVDSHVSRVVVTESGEELEIYRRSVPYGTIGEHGLFFLAFSADPHRYARMLGRMFGDDGIVDRLMRYSTPVTSELYFAPSLELLDDLLA